MKAWVYNQYGTPDVLQFKEMEKPVPNDDQVLIQVRAVSINAYDWHFLTADVFLIRLMGGGFLKPKINILGADVAGRVEAVGKNVTQFKPGDEVFGCIGSGGFGDYACAPAKSLALKPASLSFEAAAAVPMAALTALQGLRDKGQIQPGQKVLVNGASGGVGTFAVQIAKAFGAEVTAVCSTRNLDMARSIGADHVIDYTQQDFTQNGQQYDLILAANGYHPIWDYRRALTRQGTFVMAGGSLAQIIQALLLGRMLTKAGGQTFSNFMASVNQPDLRCLTELLESGRIAPVIDRCYPLSEAPEAMRYLGAGHAKAKVVITVEQNGRA